MYVCTYMYMRKCGEKKSRSEKRTNDQNKIKSFNIKIQPKPSKSIELRVKHFSSSMIRSLPSSSKFCIHVTYIQKA